MSSNFEHDFIKGMKFGEQTGEAKSHLGLGMKALCLATAVRKAQVTGCVSQYVLLDVLIDLLAEKCGGRLGCVESKAKTPNVLSTPK